MSDTQDLARLEKLLAEARQANERLSHAMQFDYYEQHGKEADGTRYHRTMVRAAYNDLRIVLGTLDELPHLLSRISELESALRRIRDGEVPRPIGERWRNDGTPSKLDRCVHDKMMSEDCGQCVDAFVSDVLGEKA